MWIYDSIRLSTGRIVYLKLYRTEVNFRDADLIADVDCANAGSVNAVQNGS